MSGRKLAFDRILFASAAGLTVFGLVMVGSASLFRTLSSPGGEYRLLVRQSGSAAAGLALMCWLTKVDYRRFNRRWVVATLLGTSAALLLLVLLSRPINGARRWIALGPVHLQASELAKLAVALLLAYTLDRKTDQLAEGWRGFLPAATVCGAMAALVLIEPDTGTAVLLGLVTMVFLYLAGVKPRHLATLAGGAAAVLAVVVLSSSYRRSRFLAFLDPSADPLGSAFQINQSLIALGSGGLTGVGLGQGQQKAFYLPFPHSDFIFSVIGEELGLLGTAGVLALFGIIFWRGSRSALRAPDNFGMFLGLALTLMLTLQALLNLGVATGLLPTKGLPLPYVSYGGSSLLASLAATGVLLNISQHSN